MRTYILYITLIFIFTHTALAGSKQPLTFRDNKFKILQLTDLHFGEDSLKDLLNVALMNYLINYTVPNFVALTGDMVSGWEWDNKSDWYQKQWLKYTSPMVLNDQDYSLTLGNHDCQANLNRTQIVNLDMTNPFSHTQQGPANITGASNYYLPVWSSYNLSQPSAFLWFIDTNQEGCLNDTQGWGCVWPSQIQWFTNEITQLKQTYGEEPLHIVFLHIPFPEYVTVYNTMPVYGRRSEGVGCPQINTGFYSVLNQQNVRAVFCGHDHDNDYGGFLGNVELVYGRKTGFGCYGPPAEVTRGGRFITISEKYNPLTGKINVTMEHDIIQGDGVYIPNNQAYLRDDKILNGCLDNVSQGKMPKSDGRENLTYSSNTVEFVEL